jgi:hypothetical protein
VEMCNPVVRDRLKDIMRNWPVGPKGTATLCVDSAGLLVTVFRFPFDFPLYRISITLSSQERNSELEI